MRFRMCRIGKVDFELMEPISEYGVIFVDGKPLVNRLSVVDYAGREFRDDIKFAFS